MKNKHQEENELEKIWEIAIMPEYLRRGSVRGQWEYYISLFWQLKAKMDDQKKQILSMKEDMEWFYERGKSDNNIAETLKHKGINGFEEAWNIYSYGLKKGEKRG